MFSMIRNDFFNNCTIFAHFAGFTRFGHFAHSARFASFTCFAHFCLLCPISRFARFLHFAHFFQYSTIDFPENTERLRENSDNFCASISTWIWRFLLPDVWLEQLRTESNNYTTAVFYCLIDVNALLKVNYYTITISTEKSFLVAKVWYQLHRR